MASCLSFASISILINGSPTKEFKLERGLRQGDPLSPFLFLIVAEALQVTILEACNKGFYNGVFLTDCDLNISLLQYVDDTLFFRKWSRGNALNLIRILKCFELASRLKVNIMKSRIMGVGVSYNDVARMASSLGCTHDTLLFSYLGLSVGKRMRSWDGWNGIINRFRDRLSSWKANSLSIGGCLTLVKSVLGSLPIYYLLLFKAPLTIINLLESIRSRFFWGFKEARRVNNGVATSFWHDPWCGSGQLLCDRFPRLYALEIDKECKVSNRWHCTNNEWCRNWSWGIPPRGRAINDLHSLILILEGLQLDSNDSDNWVWAGDVSGKFKVNSIVKSLENIILGDSARGVNIPSSCCPLCGSEVEEIEHCTIRCPRVVAIRMKVKYSKEQDNPTNCVIVRNELKMRKLKTGGCRRRLFKMINELNIREFVPFVSATRKKSHLTNIGKEAKILGFSRIWVGYRILSPVRLKLSTMWKLGIRANVKVSLDQESKSPVLSQGVHESVHENQLTHRRRTLDECTETGGTKPLPFYRSIRARNAKSGSVHLEEWRAIVDGLLDVVVTNTGTICQFAMKRYTCVSLLPVVGDTKGRMLSNFNCQNLDGRPFAVNAVMGKRLLMATRKFAVNISSVTDQKVEHGHSGIIDPREIQMSSRRYYRYIGSLTVPPCTEQVIRTVSKDQVKLLRDAVHDGKSTVTALLQRFYDPQESEVSIDGVKIEKPQLKWLRSQD
ncbi:reverse transcriptase domain, reverse transcriptase zinc-binding domain protein [Tanacetum coccineum]|uniref:Reverse transcriptase domain, reverse transcriptase zinc-binding domain protein n=1 Tax=Tanacetum coccineum TaxID=301880 RepID=A0ABQ5H4T0_9ASTR